MAYQDPYYAGQYGHQPQQSFGQPQYDQQYGQQQYGQYNHEYDPYASSGQPHPTYEPGAYEHSGGYRDDPEPQRQGTQPGYSDAPAPLTLKSTAERSSFDPGEFTPGPREPKTARNLREYRKDFQGPLWTRGSRAGCIFRFFCCSFMSIVFLVVIILLTLVLFLRPPGITFGDVDPSSGGVSLTTDGININLGVNISVENPNFFNVKFKKVNAQIYYPINDTLVGSGTANNVVFGSHAETNFTFPFAIKYSTTLDPKGLILADLVQKCGILPGSTKTDLTVNYKITVGVQILFVTISPSISNTFTFACPLSADDLKGLMGSTGIGSLRREEALHALG